jgi:hypothetical protein
MKNTQKPTTEEAAIKDLVISKINELGDLLEAHDTQMMPAVFKFDRHDPLISTEQGWPGQFCDEVKKAAILMTVLHKDKVRVGQAIRARGSTSCFSIYKQSKTEFHFTFITYPKPDSSASGVSGGPSISPETSSSPAS